MVRPRRKSNSFLLFYFLPQVECKYIVLLCHIVRRLSLAIADHWCYRLIPRRQLFQGTMAIASISMRKSGSAKPEQRIRVLAGGLSVDRY